MPVERAIMITCRGLEDHDKFTNKCELSVRPVIELELCLHTTCLCTEKFITDIFKAHLRCPQRKQAIEDFEEEDLERVSNPLRRGSDM